MTSRRVSKNILLILCIFLFFVCTSDGTLSKSDKNKKKQQQKLKENKQGGSGIVDPVLTYADILKNHFRVDYGENKKFPNAVMAYVTPWNNHGYDVAKFLAHKFTHVSPVWFQVNFNEDSNECVLGGLHDLDQMWVTDIRKNNSAIKIVPRFLFEQWTPADFQRLLTYEEDQNRCAQVLLDFIERNRFDGGVIEIWVQLQASLRGHGVKELVQLVINLAEIFNKRQKEFILPIPPTVGPAEYRRMISPDHLVQLAPYVDYFSVMLYDFPGEKAGSPGPVAPINWIRANLEAFIDARPDARRKIMMGMNFYGYDYHPMGSHVDAITGTQYLKLLDAMKPDIMWNKYGAEHYFLYKQHVVYFPTLSSVEARLNLAQELGVSVAIWESGQGLDYFYNLF